MVYAIRLRGRLEPHWVEWLDAVSVTQPEADITLVTCEVVDQAALHGVLRRVRDLGMPLISVVQVHGDRPDESDAAW
jgi:hypothetical protein